MRKTTQNDHVAEMLLERPTEYVDKIRTPGLDTLHEKKFDEIAEVLTTIVKSTSNLLELKWTIGVGIEVRVKA